MDLEDVRAQVCAVFEKLNIVHGVGEPHVLTVVDHAEVERVLVEGQFIVQFLGGARVRTFVDEDGGGEELVALVPELGSEVRIENIVGWHDARRILRELRR
jgi:hypothetical protein